MRTFPCESTTPLGSPVEPEVNITVAVASSFSAFKPGKNGPSNARGTTLATAAAQALSNLVTLPGMSSRWTSVPLGVRWTFSTTFFEVTTCRMPAWSVAASITAWLAE